MSSIIKNVSSFIWTFIAYLLALTIIATAPMFDHTAGEVVTMVRAIFIIYLVLALLIWAVILFGMCVNRAVLERTLIERVQDGRCALIPTPMMAVVSLAFMITIAWLVPDTWVVVLMALFVIVSVPHQALYNALVRKYRVREWKEMMTGWDTP